MMIIAVLFTAILLLACPPHTAKQRLIFLLPVEAGSGRQWGNPMVEARKIQHPADVSFVFPQFDSLPWYIGKQEDELLSLAARNGCGKGADCFAVGFSKSGWGLLRFIGRHPEVFKGVAIYDAPLALKSPCCGFPEKTVPSLFHGFTKELDGKINLIGCKDFCSDHKQAHELLQSQAIQHIYADKQYATHAWSAEWMESAVGVLLQ